MQPVKQLLGLDLSLNHTGWCLCETASHDILTFGVHDLEKSRLHEIEKMDFVLRWLKPMLQPGLLVMLEDFAFCARGRAVFQLAGLQYLVRHQLLKSEVPFQLITPTQAKKFLTGKHHCDKNLILKETLKRYQIDVDDDNIADAINFNKIGQAFLGLIELNNQAQREVVAALIHGKTAKRKSGKLPAAMNS
jgi:Holliday junction resolvasome RuvABC endonuclease subunit